MCVRLFVRSVSRAAPMPGSSNRLCAQVAIRQGHLISVGGRCASSLAPPCAPLQHSVCVRGADFFRGGFYAHTNPMMGRRHRGWDFDGGFLSSLHVRRFLRRALPRALPPTDQPFLKESLPGWCASLRLPDLRCCCVLRCVEGAPRSDRWPWSHA